MGTVHVYAEVFIDPPRATAGKTSTPAVIPRTLLYHQGLP